MPDEHPRVVDEPSSPNGDRSFEGEAPVWQENGIFIKNTSSPLYRSNDAARS